MTAASDVTTENATPDVVDSQGMTYLVSLPRRIVTVYLPLGVFLIVLLFPFYWMAITTFKPDQELLSREGNPFWVIEPTLTHFKKLLFETVLPRLAVEHGAGLGGRDVPVAVRVRARGLRDRAAALSRLRWSA